MTLTPTNTEMKLHRIFIKNELPAVLAPLNRLANNIWWSWDNAAQELFSSIDPDTFIELNYNPVALLETLDPARAQELAKDTDFLKRLEAVEKDFDDYMAEPFQRDAPKIAYLSFTVAASAFLPVITLRKHPTPT
jgi:starch phosphorylase